MEFESLTEGEKMFTLEKLLTMSRIVESVYPSDGRTWTFDYEGPTADSAPAQIRLTDMTPVRVGASLTEPFAPVGDMHIAVVVLAGPVTQHVISLAELTEAGINGRLRLNPSSPQA